MRYFACLFMVLVLGAPVWAQPEGGRLTVLGEGRVEQPPVKPDQPFGREPGKPEREDAALGHESRCSYFVPS